MQQLSKSILITVMLMVPVYAAQKTAKQPKLLAQSLDVATNQGKKALVVYRKPHDADYLIDKASIRLASILGHMGATHSVILKKSPALPMKLPVIPKDFD